MRALGIAGLHHIEVADDAGRIETTTVDIRYDNATTPAPCRRSESKSGIWR